MSVHQTKDGRWFAKYWEDGRNHKKYFGRGKAAKKKAELFDLKVKELKIKGMKVNQTEEGFRPLHFDELAQSYLNDRRNSGWSEKQQYDFKAFMNRYVIPQIGKKVCTDITMADVVYLKDHIARNSRKPNLSPHTINRYLTSTKAVFGWGVMNDLIPYDPWAKFRKPREKPERPQLLTLEEFLSVINNAAPHCRWALDVEYNTGCRPGSSELFKLKFSDVNWEMGEITIRATKTPPRVVKLKPDFVERLKKAYECSNCEYIVSYKDRPLKKLRRSVGTALRKAGIKKKVRLYDVRHMYGTFMVRNGADICAVQELMGHSDISTTRRYLHHAEEMKAEAVHNCLPDLNLDPQ